jgi:UDP-N-acetylglucosamine 1-carboxyvinyltransferase
MDNFYIIGKKKLAGTVKVSVSKNSSLPILAATLLCSKKVQFQDLPNLRDIDTTKKLLLNLGAVVENDSFYTPDSISLEAPYELVKKMRASILVLGPLLGRFKKAKVSLPGGCAIGTRPIDIHLKALEALGAEIKISNGYVEAKTAGLIGKKIDLPFASVGATENILMAAVFAKGTTIISNAAKEPEIIDLCNFLKKAFPALKVSGEGTADIKIEGIAIQDNATITYKPIADRIEAATYVIAGVLTSSNLKIENCVPEHFEAVLNALREMGASFKVNADSVETFENANELKAINIVTETYPGFPTDVQAQIMTLLTQANGTSIITEKIFENRFMHVPELKRMGAVIDLKDRNAIIQGKSDLTAAPVMCTDLRASAALVLASLISKGQSKVQRVYHIDRGYESIDSKLLAVGADIKRVNEPME